MMPRRSLAAKLPLAAALCALPPVLVQAAPIAVEGPACFVAEDNAQLKFQVIQQAPPPKAGEIYPFYPLTGVASAQMGTLGAVDAPYARYYFQWANRSNQPVVNARGRAVMRKANLQQTMGPQRKQRSSFSSVAKANACTMAQAANVLGRADDARKFAEGSGVVLARETGRSDGDTSGGTDICVLADGPVLPPSVGLMLDYEVQDQRSVDQTTAFLREYVAFVHGAGHKALLMTNPLDAPSQSYTGISAKNAHAIMAAFDQTTIWLWSRNRQQDIVASYEAQKALVAAGGHFDGSRVLIEFELAGTSIDDARRVRDLILRDRLSGVLFWRNGVQQGGACDTAVNLKIATLALGQLK